VKGRLELRFRCHVFIGTDVGAHLLPSAQRTVMSSRGFYDAGDLDLE
jgi:hypothetical protein